VCDQQPRPHHDAGPWTVAPVIAHPSFGNSYHNAQAESYMKSFKAEEVYISGYETYADIVERLPMFIEHVYNARRMHSAYGYVSDAMICLP
jgi:transposase InsO family protein